MKVKTSFLSQKEIEQIGFKKFGENVLISKYASFYNPTEISLGNNVRIDDFCILSGKIDLGSFIHISAYSALYGKYGIQMKDFSGISPHVLIFSASDDFSGDFLIGPMIPSNLNNVKGGKVTINKFCQIGAGSLIFPNVIVGEGTAVGALSLVTKNLDEWGIYAGTPAKYIKARSKKLIMLSEKLK